MTVNVSLFSLVLQLSAVEMMNRVEKGTVAARRGQGFIWKECAGFRPPYYSWHYRLPCAHIITTLNVSSHFFSPFSIILLPSFLFFSLEGGCVIKWWQAVVGGGPSGEWRSIKGCTVWGNAAAPCGGLVARVTDLSATTVSFYWRQKMIGWSLNPHFNSFFKFNLLIIQ